MANSLINKSTLGYLGNDFQYKLAKEFVERKGFFNGIYRIIDQNAFTVPYLRTFVGAMLDFYKHENVVPSYTSIKIMLHEMARTEADIELYDGVVKKVMETDCDGSDMIKDLAIKFFKQQKVIKVANELLKHAAEGDDKYYEKIEGELKEAINIGLEEGYEECRLYDGVETVLSDEFRTVIPTGINEIDMSLNGGLGKGELGIIIAPSGKGKTSLTTSVAQHAASFKSETNDFKGFKVLQIGFEDKLRQIQRKHFSKISQIEACNLSKPEFIDEAKSRIYDYVDKEVVNDNLIIIRCPSGKYTVEDIENIIKKHINQGFRPDLVIIDYFECLKMSGGATMSKWEKEEITMRKIEALTNEYDMAFWVPVQGNKESISTELVTMDKAGGAVQKIQIGHIIISITRSDDDVRENVGTVAILKNRAGQAGVVYQGINFNNGTCTVGGISDDAFGGCSFGDFTQKAKQKHEDDIEQTQNAILAEIYSGTKNKK